MHTISQGGGGMRVIPLLDCSGDTPSPPRHLDNRPAKVIKFVRYFWHLLKKVNFWAENVDF